MTTSMRLSGLLGLAVEDDGGERVGVVHDVVAVQAGPVGTGGDAALEVVAIVVGALGVDARLGLCPAHVRGPLVARLLAGVGRPSDRIPWSDVVAMDEHRLVVRRR